jgi:3-oxoacyl-[acyl-carrier protein] reductase
MADQLNGKIAIVTGGARDIGRSISMKFGALGAGVVVNYNNSGQEAEKTIKDLEAIGAKAAAIQADVSDEKGVSYLLEKTTEKFGNSIDILVNNAGGLVERSPVVEMEESLWDKVMALNLKSVFLMCRATIPYLKSGGAIINISSLAARSGGGPGAVPYAAAKGGVLTFTRALAKELAPKRIRVNCVEPGVIATRFHDVFTNPEVRKNFPNTIPLGREGEADEVAAAVAFLAGDASTYITGEALQINGGIYFI